MFKQLSLKTKLLIPIFSLISILVFLGSMIIVFNYTKIVSLAELKKKIVFSNLISDTLHSLQIERGLSGGYVTNQVNKYKDELLTQRIKTNIKIEALLNYLDELSSKEFKTLIKSKLFEIKDLKYIRKDVDNYLLSSEEIIHRYSIINSSLLELILSIAKSSHVPIITQNILAYSHFLYLKENVGIERAMGVVILSRKDSSVESLIQFTNLLAIQKQNELMFLNFASNKTKKYYKRTIKTDIFKNVSKIEECIIAREFLTTEIDSKYSFDTITKKLNIFDKIGKYIKTETTNQIIYELKDAKKFFILVIILTLLSIFIFILMLIAIFKITKEEQRLRVVMDKYIISSVTDLKGIIIDVSQAFCNISGYSKNELIGKNHNIVRHPDMPKEAFRELWEKIKNGESWSGKVKNLKKDGDFYWVYANIEPLYNAKGEIDAYISIRLDITENELLTLKIQEEEDKNEANEKLMQQQHRLAQMGEMLSMIAHQWRQPLSAITAAAGSLSIKAKRDKLTPQLAIDISNKIQEFSLHLSSTIDDFRNFFKSNKDKNITDYKKLIDSVLLIAESSLKINDIKLTQDIGTLQEFNTYDNEIKQVLLNLIKNAEDALLEKNIENPNIIIKVDKNILTIKDNAGGINEDIMDKIFEPYFSTKMKKDGTGLGLYMSKMIIENHCNGSLSVKNTTSGAEFKIVLGEQDD